MSEKKNPTYTFKPRDWQKHCLEHLKRFSVVAVHRRAGKTILAVAGLLLPKALTMSNAVFAYVCPQLKQAKRIAWKPLKEACMQLTKDNPELIEVRESELIIKFWNGCEIQLYGADNPDNIRGTKLAGVVLDEVAQMPSELWSEIVYPALMDSHGFALFIGTPKGVNLFSDLFTRGNDPKFSENWVSFLFTCYETQALSDEEIAEYKRSVSDETFKREMLCDFNAASEENLISVQLARDATTAEVDEKLNSRFDLVLGVDVARHGADRSVLCFRSGMLVEEPITYLDLDLVTLASKVRAAVNSRKPKYIFIDGTGVGGGLVDILSSWGIYTEDINFGHKAIENFKYNNRRTEMWCRMAEWLKHGGCIPNNAALIKELAMPTYEVRDDGVIVLESKNLIRKRLGESPDLADALALTFAQDIKPREEFNFDDYLEQYSQLTHVERNNYNDNPWSLFEHDISA